MAGGLGLRFLHTTLPRPKAVVNHLTGVLRLCHREKLGRGTPAPPSLERGPVTPQPDLDPKQATKESYTASSRGGKDKATYEAWLKNSPADFRELLQQLNGKTD